MRIIGQSANELGRYSVSRQFLDFLPCTLHVHVDICPMPSILYSLDELENYVAANKCLVNRCCHRFGIIVAECLQQDRYLVTELYTRPREIHLLLALQHGV